MSNKGSRLEKFPKCGIRPVAICVGFAHGAPMITAIVRAGDDIEALGATLAALVPGVAQGVLRDPVIVDLSGGSEVRTIADATGTAYVRPASGDDPWRAGAQAGRGAWLLLLEAGDVPGVTWIAEIGRFLIMADRDAPPAAVLRRGRPADPIRDRPRRPSPHAPRRGASRPAVPAG